MNTPPVPARQSAGNLRLWGELALISMMLMEAFWITDWYGVSTRSKADSWVTGGFILGVLILSHVFARGLNRSKLKWKWRRLLFGIWILLAVLAGFFLLMFAGENFFPANAFPRIVDSFLRDDAGFNGFWHTVFLLLIIYHAVQLAREPLQLYIAQANFQLGLFLLLIYGLIFGWNNPAQALLTTYGFLFCAIVAMSATRISTLSELRGGRLPALGPPWLFGILATASLVVGLAVLTGWFATNVASQVITFLTTLLFGIMIVLGVIVFFPVILLILSLGPTLRDIIETLSKITIFSDLLKFVQSTAKTLGISPELIANVVNTGKPVVILGILGGILALVLAALVWKPWQRRLVQEDAAGMLSLRAALRFPRLFLRRFSGRLSSGGQRIAAARIRFIYAQLMALCARLGKPRRESATPLEYLPVTQELFPAESATLEAITQAYLKVRYGEMLETFEEVQTVLLGWERIQNQGRRLFRERKRKILIPR